MDPRKALPTNQGVPGEEGTSPDLVMVRTVLQRLPKAECPVGFEMRLQRRLEGRAIGRSSESSRNWSLGWTGLSLGFAAALIIGFFAFDVNLPAGFGVRSGTVAGTIAEPVQIQEQQPPAMATTDAQAEQQAVAEKSPAVKDSSPVNQPRELPAELFHVAGAER